MSSVNDADNFLRDHPDVKFGEFIEEDITVRELTPEKTPDGIKLSYKDVPAKQKTMYINAPMNRAICAQGRHRFIQEDAGRSLYKCTRCTLHQKAHPPTYKFDPTSGTLTHRKTGELV